MPEPGGEGAPGCRHAAASHAAGRVSGVRRPVKRKTTQIGWREIVALPGLGLHAVKAKVDTGARTSALDASDIRVFERAGREWVEFKVSTSDNTASISCEEPITDRRMIKNTGGVPENRIIITTDLVIGPRHWPIELSLANRVSMGFTLILGRTAVRGRRITINPGRSFLAGDPIELRDWHRRNKRHHERR